MDNSRGHLKIIVGANYLQQVSLNISSLTNTLQGEQLVRYINNMIRTHGKIDDFSVDPFFRHPADVARYMVKGGKNHKGEYVNFKPVTIHYSDRKAIDKLESLKKLIKTPLKTNQAKDIPDRLWEINGVIARHNQDNIIVFDGLNIINKKQALIWLKELVNSDSADTKLASVSDVKKRIINIENSKDNTYLVQGTGIVETLSEQDCINLIIKAERKLRLSILSRIGFKSCRKCQKQIFKTDAYCPYCGKKQSSIFDKWRSNKKDKSDSSHKSKKSK